MPPCCFASRWAASSSPTPRSSSSCSRPPERRKFFASLGLPSELAYVTIAAEIIGGLALIAGFRTRIVALALTPILLGAIVLVHGSAGFFFNNANGGWEYPAFWIVALVAQALLGDGAFALSSSRGTEVNLKLAGAPSR